MHALLAEGYAQVGGAWVRIVEGCRAAGMIDPDVPAGHVARTMTAPAQGFIAQQALFGEIPVGSLRDGLRALMTMDLQKPG